MCMGVSLNRLILTFNSRASRALKYEISFKEFPTRKQRLAAVKIGIDVKGRKKFEIQIWV